MNLVGEIIQRWKGTEIRPDARSLAKSAYYSRRHTGRWESLLLHRNVICDIDPEAAVDIAPEGRFVAGFREGAVSRPDLGRSMLKISGGGRLVCPSKPAVLGPCSILTIEGTFEMGNSYFNSHCRVVCGESIRIGDGCTIAWGVELLDDNRHLLEIDGTRQPRTKPIVIEDDVWIGRGASIMKGVTIHSGSVVAADSVVVSDVPPGTLVAGHPAEVIREDIKWGDLVLQG